ncbi:hypothetical protein [Inhella sp.]|uniref:hypothetical protein n=1 Tax=Inhella sp. TaxID=1921806 RepID=UPI0035B17588
MKLPSRRLLLFALAALCFLSPLLGLALALQTEPRLPELHSRLGPAELARGRQLLRQLDPRRLPADSVSELRLREADLNTLLAHSGQRAQLQLRRDGALLQASLPWKLGPWPVWLNLELELDSPSWVGGAVWPQPRRLRIGRLPLPPSLSLRLARSALERRFGAAPWAAVDMVEAVRLDEEAVWLRWRWQPQQAAAALASLWPQAEQEALRAQHRRWQALVGQLQPPRPSVELAQLLPELAREALARVEGGQAAAAELRALWLQLALRSVGRDPGRLIGDPDNRPSPGLRLAGREDMAQHFLISAWLAAQGAGQMGDALGLAKELSDTQRGGSGFSFNDLAADRAGERIGRLGSGRPLELLRLLAQQPPETAFFPKVADLPEFLSRQRLQQEFGGVDGPGYRALMTEIERRIDALAVHRGLSGGAP